MIQTKYPSWVNGKIVPAGSAAIPAEDLGFLHGYGIYETTAVIGGRAVFLDDHLLRMEQGRAFLELPENPWNLEEICGKFLQQVCAQEAALRITLTGGHSGVPTVALTLRDMPRPQLPISLIVSRWTKFSKDPLETIKTVCRVRHWMAREEAQREGAFDALICTEEGDFSEGTVSNLFIVREGSLRTPSVQRGILRGVTREKILKLASSLGISVEETSIFPEDLKHAEEIFISNSLVGVLPVSQIQGLWKQGAAAEGPLTGVLREGYFRQVQEALR